MKRAFMAAFFLSFFLLPSAAEAFSIGVVQVAIPTGLVGHWTFDGKNLVRNATDSSGQGNNGFLTNFTSTTTVAGKVGQALDFDGVNDSVTVTHSANQLLATGGTLSAWIKPSLTASAARIFHKGTGFGTSGYSFFVLSDQLGAEIAAGGVVLSSAGTIEGDRWTHVVAVFSGSNTVTLYKDGVRLTSGSSGSLSSITSTQSLAIGRRTDADDRMFEGIIDDARLYNRALTDAEVMTLYRATGGAGPTVGTTPTGGGTISSGLVLHQTFDGKNLVRNATDSSGQGNNGFLTSFTSTTTVAGKVGQALRFDGTDDYVDIPSSSSLSITGPLALSAWARPTATPSNFDRVIERSTDTGDRPYVMDVVNNHYRCYLTSASETFAVAEGTSAVRVNQWTHIGCSYDGNNLRIFVNGVLEATSGTFTAGSKNNSKPVRIGVAETTGGDVLANFFEGYIDDVRIYNRALSVTEVASLYKSTGGAGPTLAATPTGAGGLSGGLIGHWTFDGKNMIRNVADSSGQGNNGNLTNFTSTTTTAGKVGQALRFDGVNDWVRVSDDPDIDVGTGDFSLSVWMRPELATRMRVLNKFDNSDALGFILDVNQDSTGASTVAGNLRIRIQDVNNNNFSGAVAAGITANVWQHVVMTVTRGSATGVAFYRNGVLMGTLDGSAVTASLDNTEAFGIGALPASVTTIPFKGDLDDVRLYNRALSDSEVKSLYNLGR